MKRVLSLALALVLGLSLVACGSKGAETEAESEAKGTESSTETTGDADETEPVAEADSDETVYKIGVIQLVEHAALDASYQGFIDGLDEAGLKYEIDFQNAQGDQPTCTTIATKLVNDKNDLILAIATPAAQAVAGQTSDIPILVTAVTDPESSGLVESNKEPNTNVSGTSDSTPIAAQMDLIQELLPEAKTVGVLYCSAEANSEFQLNMTKEACAERGLEVKEFAISSTNEIQQVVSSMIGKVDVLYSFTDNTIAANMATVAMVANENGLPCVVGEIGMYEAGGLATYGIDYYALGKMTAAQAVRILRDDEDVSKMPIEYLSSDSSELMINKEVAEQLNITVPDSLKDGLR